ncbi:hypothetical protein CQ018_10575 [Arthrobacter sp. MYb227]|uniref:DUF937 domain-containing protein n=1 Tax=Arthrobacter sp. MYb227 TaxID=1848601 RepID=UPI000CFCA091|nr:DUF937 domain-containing protein [Arthrobacter sp. MYb227]PQZ92910.1 hypothetical protein CQ018_10575 [Arthrobacter sp. MYb227]
MTNLNDLLNILPLDQIAGKLGVDGETARATVATALPSLVAGMQNNASSPEGAQALQSAIQQHDASLLDNGLDIEAVDVNDGQKIVNHVLGENQSALVSQLSSAAPAGLDLGALVQKALPMLAPIVMSFLAKNSASTASEAPNGGGLDIGGMLGGLLGGGQQQGGGGLDLGGMLGGLLGGGGAQQAQGEGGLDIGGMLGGLLGGGQQQADQPQAGGLDLGGILGGLFGKK